MKQVLDAFDALPQDVRSLYDETRPRILRALVIEGSGRGANAINSVVVAIRDPNGITPSVIMGWRATVSRMLASMASRDVPVGALRPSVRVSEAFLAAQAKVALPPSPNALRVVLITSEHARVVDVGLTDLGATDGASKPS